MFKESIKLYEKKFTFYCNSNSSYAVDVLNNKMKARMPVI